MRHFISIEEAYLDCIGGDYYDIWRTKNMYWLPPNSQLGGPPWRSLV